LVWLNSIDTTLSNHVILLESAIAFCKLLGSQNCHWWSYPQGWTHNLLPLLSMAYLFGDDVMADTGKKQPRIVMCRKWKKEEAKFGNFLARLHCEWNYYPLWVKLYIFYFPKMLWSTDIVWISCVTVSDKCRRWHDTDNYNYTELCDFIKLLMVSACHCTCPYRIRVS